jgi:hypothetical protein
MAERRAVRGRGGQRPRFGRAGEHIAAVTQFRQHDQFGALARGQFDRGGRGRAVRPDLADGEAKLARRDEGHRLLPSGGAG